VAFVGKRTWTVTLKPGKYTYQCDPHAASGMKGSFRVIR
jgi:plastocyanin